MEDIAIARKRLPTDDDESPEVSHKTKGTGRPIAVGSRDRMQIVRWPMLLPCVEATAPGSKMADGIAPVIAMVIASA